MVNINFPPIVQPSSLQPDRYVHVQALHSDAYKYNFFNSTIRTWGLLLGVRSTTQGHSINKQAHMCRLMCGLILECSLAEAFHSLNVIVPVEVNCVYLLIFQGYHLCVTTCCLELPKGRSYNIHMFLTTCVSV